MSLFTYRDFTDYLADVIHGSGEKDQRDYRRVAVEALREVADAHKWTHYITHGRLNVTAPYTTGTVAYDHTGGTYERQVTLTNGTWPDWAQDGVIELEDFNCEVERVISSTVLTLSERSNPGEDLDAGTGYTLSRDSYLAPSDFYKPITGLRTPGKSLGPEYVETMLLGDGFRNTYTLMGSPNYLGAMVFRFDPPPTTAANYDFWYYRKPRALRVENETTGNIATAGTTTVTGTGTAFSSSLHTGCVIRLSANSDVPTGDAGDNVAEVERVILSVESATSLTVDAAFPETVSGRGYSISDPVDVASHMQDYLMRTAEHRLALLRNRTDGLSALLKEKEAALIRSAGADNRSAGRRFVGRGEYNFGDPIRFWHGGS